MKIELIIGILEDVEDELTLQDLADLTKDVTIDYVGERAEFNIRLVSSHDELIQLVKNHLFDARGANCLVISDQLIRYDRDHQEPVPSQTAQAIFQQVRDSTSVCGLIALTETATPHVQGIDANTVSGRTGRDQLREELEKITIRLWYKKPPKNLFHHNGGHLFSLEIVPVYDQRALQQSLELRGRVYSALGYIEPSNQQSCIEMDAYDLTSVHFLAMDRANQDRIAGTMRLIIPGLNSIVGVTNPYNLDDYEEWSRNIAKTSIDRRWWRIIHRGAPSALPVLDAFAYFQVPEQTLDIDPSLMPRNNCELSRVIVAPEYRGMGVSSLLVNHAISVAKDLRRQYIWLECAPHHIKMYQKYGFIVKDHQGHHFYERAQRLDTWAVAMSLPLKATQGQSATTKRVCYRLQIDDTRSGNCSLLFRLAPHSTADVEQVFDSSIHDDQSTSLKNGVRGVSTSLKTLIPTTLTCLDIDNFIHCLKALMNRVKVEKLSFQHSCGRSFSFNPEDINSSKRAAIESGLLQWLR